MNNIKCWQKDNRSNTLILHNFNNGLSTESIYVKSQLTYPMNCTQGMVKNPRRQMSHLFMFVCVLIILISTQKERNFPYLGLWKKKFISLKHAVAYKWKRKHYCYRCNVLQRGGKDPIRIRHELFTRIRKVQCAVAENMVSVYETVC